MRREIDCAYCGHKVWVKTRKMYVIWVVKDVQKEIPSSFSTPENPQVHIINETVRLRTYGAVDSMEKARAVVVKDLKKGEYKEYEKIMTIQDNYCGKCKHDAKTFRDRYEARLRREAKMRAKVSGDKSGIVAPIKDEDYKSFLKYQVQQKVGADLQAKQKAEEEAMKKRERLLASSFGSEEGKPIIKEGKAFKQDNT